MIRRSVRVVATLLAVALAATTSWAAPGSAERSVAEGSVIAEAASILRAPKAAA